MERNASVVVLYSCACILFVVMLTTAFMLYPYATLLTSIIFIFTSLLAVVIRTVWREHRSAKAELRKYENEELQ